MFEEGGTGSSVRGVDAGRQSGRGNFDRQPVPDLRGRYPGEGRDLLMLGPRTQLLLSVGSDPLAERVVPTLATGRVFDELVELLSERNGFYAFEGALHVFGWGVSVPGRSLDEWNAGAGWRASYEGFADGFFFFAEDAFGAQFAIREENVWTFDPETGDAEVMASSLEDWADQVVGNYSVLTGFPVAHAWQGAHGPIGLGQRLVPKRPFVLGGEFDASNVYVLDAVEGMRLRADLALQIKNLPDGAKIRYKIVE